MAKKTTFLLLTLPEFEEFENSWHTPINENMEDIDTYLLGLSDDLGSSSLLKGTMADLATRLDVSINSDGTIDLSGSPSVTGLSSSPTQGTQASPDDNSRGRFDVDAYEVYDARQPFPGDRFNAFTSAGPTAGFPEEMLDSGIAFRTADYGAKSSSPISSPQIPFAPGLVTGGTSPLISSPGGVGILRLDGSTNPAVFNIDGYVFRLREALDLDYTALAPADLNYIWFYVERGDYNNANFTYNQTAGYSAKDLRILQSGVNGAMVASTGVFIDAAATFNTSVLGKVREGDVLVIDTTAAAGKYAIKSVDGNTQVTIRGIFKADVSGAAWHIQDDMTPNVGAVETDANKATLPAYKEGRVYIGRCKHNAAAIPSEIVTFAPGGVYDSGWVSVTATTSFPYKVTHNLGVQPSSVEVTFKKTATSANVYQPVVERQIVTKMDSANFPNPVAGDTSTAIRMLLPSVRWYSDSEDAEVILANKSTAPALGLSLFTDEATTEIPSGFMRVVCRR